MLKGQGEMEQQGNGGTRESSKGRGAFHLFPYEAMEALAIWYEQGAEKYGDRNWENGLMVSDSINRMVRHAIKAANGWTDEDHLAAVMWNAACAITMEKRKGMEEFRDHPWKRTIGCDFTGEKREMLDVLENNEDCLHRKQHCNVIYGDDECCSCDRYPQNELVVEVWWHPDTQEVYRKLENGTIEVAKPELTEFKEIKLSPAQWGELLDSLIKR